VTTTDRQIHPHLHLTVPSSTRPMSWPDPSNGAGVVTWMLDRARTGLCALQLA